MTNPASYLRQHCCTCAHRRLFAWGEGCGLDEGGELLPEGEIRERPAWEECDCDPVAWRADLDWEACQR